MPDKSMVLKDAPQKDSFAHGDANCFPLTQIIVVLHDVPRKEN